MDHDTYLIAANIGVNFLMVALLVDSEIGFPGPSQRYSTSLIPVEYQCYLNSPPICNHCWFWYHQLVPKQLQTPCLVSFTLFTGLSLVQVQEASFYSTV